LHQVWEDRERVSPLDVQLSGEAVDQIVDLVVDRIANHPTVAVMPIPAVMKVSTAAKILDCDPATVRRRIADGSLRAVIVEGVTKILGDDLIAYINSLESVPRAATTRSRRRRPTRSFDFLRE
jgi:hypothetical protein